MEEDIVERLRLVGVMEIDDDLATIAEAADEIERLRAALAGAEAWLDVWAEHVGDCDGGVSCTCGLTAIHFKANAALFPEPVPQTPREPTGSNPP